MADGAGGGTADDAASPPSSDPHPDDPREDDPAEPAGLAEPAEPVGEASRRPSRVRSEAYAFLEVAALSGVALAQPLLDVIGKSPDFFLFYGAGRAEILLMVATFILLPPLALWGIGALLGVVAGPRLRRIAHVVTLGALFVLLAVQIGKQLLPVRGVPLVLAAVAAGVALALAYRAWDAARQLVRLAAVGPVVFALLFVFASPASAVVLGGDRAAGAAAGTGKGGKLPPIVMIILDELPLVSLLDGAGKIDAARYPNFAALAGGSTWYRNATAVSGWTPYALPGMLTGKYPTREVAPHYSQYPDNLFTLLTSRYDLQVQESITQLCPPRSCERDASRRGGLPTMLKESAELLQEIVSPQETRRDPTASFAEPTVAEGDKPPPTDPKFRWDTLDDNQPVRFREFVTGLANDRPSDPARPAARPTAHVLHLLMPHTPWRYLPTGVRYEAPEDLPTDGAWWPQLAHQRHLQQLQYADLLLGETLKALRDSGTYDDSLVVVTADHGVTFAADSVGRGLGHVRLSPAEVLWVPTFIKAPGQKTGVVDDRNWQHVDLLPTIADLAGVTVPWPVDGISARGEPRAGTKKLFYDSPTARVELDGADSFKVITGERHGIPRLPPMPAPELIGRSTKEFVVSGTGPRATVANLAAFANVDPASGTIPALVYGSVPAAVPTNALLAIAVNGRIGAVAPVLVERPDRPRFAGLVTDPTLFTAGANRLELYVVQQQPTGAPRLQRLAL